MGAEFPPWYGKNKTYYEKQLKKAKAKLEVKKLEVEELEEEIKVFEGELLQKEYDMESLYNFSMMSSYEYKIDSSVNRIEIRLTE